MRRLPLLAAVAVVACSSSERPQAQPVDAGVETGPAAKPPYELTILDNARITSKGDDPNFQNARGPIELPDGPFEKVTMRVELGTTCFPFETWKTNPPPSGQNWPADCDAFDRNFETSLEDPAKPEGVGLELVRAITPFGGPLTIEKDVTDVFNAIREKRTLRVHITTWSDGAGKVSGSNGGWNVTVKFSVTPGTPPRKVLAVRPLFYGSVDSKDATQKLPFEVPAGATSGRIEYRVTGHGGGDGTATGCTQPADEFCKRTHRVSLDGAEIANMIPWRSDCRTLCTLGMTESGMDYCEQNPCGAIASVRAPRANWCPGSETPPFVYEELDPLRAPGNHDLGFSIEKIADGGSWRVSAVYFAYGQ
jgi:hypothetical protein